MRRWFAPPALGFSVVDGAVAAVSLERRAFKVVVTRARRIAWARPEDGASRPRVGLEPRALAALKALLSEIGRPVLERVCVTYPGLGTVTRWVEVPAMNSEQVVDMARYELLRTLRGSPDDYRVVLEPAASRGGDAVGVCAAAVPKSHVRAFLADLEEAGLGFDALLPAPAAVYAFARYDRPHAGDRVLLHVGLRATDIVYEHAGGFVYRTLPLGVVGLIGRSDDRLEATRRLCDRVAQEVGRGVRFHFPGGFHPDQVLLLGEGAFDEDVVAHFDRQYPGRLVRCDRYHRLLADPRAGQGPGGTGERDPAAVGAALVAARIVPAPLLLFPFDRPRAATRRLPALAAAALALTTVSLLAARREIVWAEAASEARVRPSLAELKSRAEREDLVRSRTQRLARRRERLAARLLERRAEVGLLVHVAGCFGPENRTFGSADLRLRSLEARAVSENPHGPGEILVEGTALVVEGRERAATVLRQRLLDLPGVREAAVDLLDEPKEDPEDGDRDEPPEPPVLSFRARFSTLWGDAR